jgi:hypothetical protein
MLMSSPEDAVRCATAVGTAVAMPVPVAVVVNVVLCDLAGARFIDRRLHQRSPLAATFA